MKSAVFSLNEVLAVARIHPFYAADVQYPPDANTLRSAVESAAKDGDQSAQELALVPLTTKKVLYKAIARLTADTSPDNTYRQASYLSITGGGSGGAPMLFATDAAENRTQRARTGELIRACGLVDAGDWVLSTHVSGHFYRSLDLTLEILENAGASVLGAGNHMEPDEVTSALASCRVNILAGDGSQVLRIIRHISTLAAEERRQIRLDKIIYTSEPLTHVQRAYIADVLGPVKVCSILGSSEAGPWALGCPHLTGDQPQAPGAADFVFDTRTMLVEILDPSTLDDADNVIGAGTPVPDGQPGIVVQTSLQRLKNPLVRYVSGDIGSLHPLPDSTAASTTIPPGDREHLRILRLRGRDRRFSFKWYGAYFQFDNMADFMHAEEWRILHWQVILGNLESSPQLTLEVRLLLSPDAPRARLTQAVETFFFVLPENRHLFHIKFVENLTEFERSSTGGKVMSFLDKAH